MTAGQTFSSKQLKKENKTQSFQASEFVVIGSLHSGLCIECVHRDKAPSIDRSVQWNQGDRSPSSWQWGGGQLRSSSYSWRNQGWLYPLIFPKVTVSVHVGCYNKMPQTEWLIHIRNLVLMVLEVEKSKIKVDLVSGRAHFLVHRRCLVPVSPDGERNDLWSLPPLLGTNPFQRAPPSWPNPLPTAKPPNPISLGDLVFSLWILGGHRHSAQRCHVIGQCCFSLMTLLLLCVSHR